MYDVCHCCGEFLVDKEAICEYCEDFEGTPTMCCNRYPHLRSEERKLEGVRMSPQEGKDFEWENEYCLDVSGSTTVNVCGTEDESESELLDKAYTWHLDFDDIEVDFKSLIKKNVQRIDMEGEVFDVKEWERENGMDEWSEPWEKERAEPRKITEF